MKRARYFVRFDDASPFWDRRAWTWWLGQVEQMDAPGVIGVIPDNRNEALMFGDRDESFWDAMRDLQGKGWCIALHGLTHMPETDSRGLYGFAQKSEFAGLSVQAQLEKLERGYAVLVDQGLAVDAFFAPWHSFDEKTVEALARFGRIPVLVEGLAWHPYVRWQLKWTPCQLWRIEPRPYGMFGLCLHPDTSTSRDRQRFSRELQSGAGLMAWKAAVAGIEDWKEFGISQSCEEHIERLLTVSRNALGGLKREVLSLRSVRRGGEPK